MNNIPQTNENGNNPENVDVRARKRSTSLPLGLSTAHISPEGGFSIYPDGQIIKIERPKNTINPQVGGGKRGSATFSKASRRRLLHKCASTNKKCVPLLVTMTYPKEFPVDAEIWKTHLDNFAKRFFRRFPGAGFAWKLEPQKRGAPHYHLLVWGVTFIWLYAFVAINWYEVVGSGDEKHLEAGTRVEKVRNPKGSKSYFAKYIGKSETTWERGVGRYWGFRGDIPWSGLFSIQINDLVAIQMMRYQRRYIRRVVKVLKDEKGKKIKVITKPLKGRGYRSLTCMVEDPMRWAYLYQYTFDVLKPRQI